MTKFFQITLIIITGWLISSCGDENSVAFSKSSDDGVYKIEGIEKNRSSYAKSQLYIFSDRVEPERVASQIIITSKDLNLTLPKKLSAKIAYPSTISFHGYNVKAGTGTINLRGGDGAGSMILELSIKKNKLTKAVAHTVASDTPEHHYP